MLRAELRKSEFREMKIERFRLEDKVRYCVVEQDTVFSLIVDLYTDFQRGDRLCRLPEVRLLAPVEPTIVVGIGRNYAEHVHAREMGVRKEPTGYFKPRTSVIGPLDNIVYPKISQDVWYEGELAVVIKRRAKEVTEEKAKDYILGYTCGNDVTAMDIRQKDGRLMRAKSFDTFCPLGPFIVTQLDGNNLAIKSMLNGLTKQDSSTRNMVFRVEKLVSFVSQFMVLLPGDVILTGAPAGGCPIHIGDTVEIEIEGIGTLTNRVAARYGEGCLVIVD